MNNHLPHFCGSLQTELEEIQDKFIADESFFKFHIAAKSRRKQSRSKWQNGAMFFWLQDCEAQCMMSCMSFLQGNLGIKVGALIHDGVLVDKKSAYRIDLNNLTELVKASTRLECSFAIKDLAPEAENLAFAKEVDEAYEEHVARRLAVIQARDPFTAMMEEAATKLGCISVIAKMFHYMFPKRFAYLGSGGDCGWYSYKQPKWRHIKDSTHVLYKLLNEDFTMNFEKSIGLLKAEEDVDGQLIGLPYIILNKQLGNHTFKDGVIKELRSNCGVEDLSTWLTNMNSESHLLGFDECVYDWHYI